ncbi:hypothetical protein C8F04DRAFT_1395230 [Mycena alexandri]|uniref:F-box domain-containing protein n=1 Tax=Mycena alexandri TaxID=1745969 RepID=A0AAD6SVN7_9AGAR|nr:hypothetical protein C8F04DRAFT_1395230 [Mycena alexandri]
MTATSETTSSISAAALKIPYELTARIFLLCLPRDRRVRPSPKSAPLLLAQICGDWRALAISVPELWNSIHLDFLHRVRYDGISALFGVDTYPVPAPIVQLSDSWFTRAAGLPLSITICCADFGMSLPEGLITLIMAKFTQWGRLELRISRRDLAAFHHPGPFPMLQTLAIDVTDVRGLAWNQSMFCCAPNLQALRLGAPLWGTFRLPMAPGPPTSVTALDFCLDCMGVTPEFFRPLGHFPNLRHLKISSRRIGYRYLSFIVAIPRLETLFVKHSPILLNHLQIPTLRHLGIFLFSDIDATTITSFLTRSACMLTHLTLRAPGGDRWCDYFHLTGRPCNSSALLKCLEAVPSVVDISLAGDEALYSPFHRGDILPRLHTLRFTSWPSTTVHAAFLAVLRARPALQSADLHLLHRAGEVTPPPNNDVLADLSIYAAGGIHINLTTQSVGRSYMEFKANTEECEESIEGYDLFAPDSPLPRGFAPFKYQC